MKNKFFNKPGFILALIGIIGMFIAFVVQGLTLLEKAIIVVICGIVFVGGTLSETSFFNKYRERHEESWK